MRRRLAQYGFTSPTRSAEHGFTSPRRSAEHGFTLVEVMVALLIFGMLAAAGVAILSFSIRAQAATGGRLDDVSALNRTVSLLSGDLGQALDRPARDQAGTMLPAFVGEADGRLSLVRAGWSNVDASARAGIQKVDWRIQDGALVRQAYPMLDGAAPLTAAVLLDHVTGIGARYRYRGAWSDRWDGAADAPLPDAVELTIQRAGGRSYRAMMLVGTGYAPVAIAAAGPVNAAP